MSSEEEKLIKEIASIFRSEDVKFQADVVVGNVSSDFYVVAPSGSTAVFEIKSWEPTPSNQIRATNLASLYKKTSGANNAYIVMPSLEASRPELGILSANKFKDFLEDHLLKERKRSKLKVPKVEPKPDKRIFAAMPFTDKYDDTFLVAMQPAALEVNAECVRVDHQSFTGDIVFEIKKLVKSSIAVIADLSESRPNVLYELGLADAMDRMCIQICSTDSNDLPFDVRNNKTISYKIGQTSRLRKKLVEELRNLGI